MRADVLRVWELQVASWSDDEIRAIARVIEAEIQRREVLQDLRRERPQGE